MRWVLILCSLFPVRLGLYAALEIVVLQAIVVTITRDGPWILQEDGPVEWVHFGLMVGTGVIFLWNKREKDACSSVLLFCSLVAFTASLRELDQYSEVVLFRGSYKYPIAVIAVLALYCLWKDRRRLRNDIAAFIKKPAFLLLSFGFFQAAVVAQILGQAEVWHALIETESARSAKRVFEETLETIGYLTVFFGAIEASPGNATKITETKIFRWANR